MVEMSRSIALARPGRASRRRIAWLASAVVAVLAVPRGGAADPGDAATAAALFTDGNAAMARDDAATAAERYRAAWRLVPEARFALNLGIALAVQGRNAAAAEAFTVYLADPTADPDKRAVLEDRLREWRATLGEIVLDVTPPTASIEIDGTPPLRTARGARVPIAAGSHLVTARARGYQGGELRLEVGLHQHAVARLALTPLPPAASASVDPDRDETVERSGKWVALGVAIAAAAAGSYFGATAIGRWHTVDDHCPRGACTSPADLALARDAHSAGTRADVAFAVSGAALLAAVVLWRLEPRRSPARTVSLMLGSSGGLLCIAGAL